MTAVANSEKEKYWRAEMDRYKDFTGSQAAFCRERGLSLFQFQYWARRLGKVKAKNALMASPFIPVRVSEPKLSESLLPDPQWLAEFIVSLNRATR